MAALSIRLSDPWFSYVRYAVYTDTHCHNHKIGLNTMPLEVTPISSAFNYIQQHTKH
jgi:hypothetical protein